MVVEINAVTFSTIKEVPDALLLADHERPIEVCATLEVAKLEGVLAKVYKVAVAVVDALPALSVTEVMKEYCVLGVRPDSSHDKDEVAPLLELFVVL